MSNRIDKFNARYAKAQAIKKEKETAIETQETVVAQEEIVEVSADTMQETDETQSKKSELILIDEKSIKDAFEKWLIENGHAKKYVPQSTIASIEKASEYAVSRKLSKVSFLEIIDVKKFNAIRTKLQQDKIYRIQQKGSAKAFEAAGLIFSQFLKAYDFSNYTNEPIVKQVAQGDDVGHDKIVSTNGLQVAEDAVLISGENDELKTVISSIQTSFKSAIGKRFIAETTPWKNDGFVFDIISNKASVGKVPIECPEFIRSNDNALYEVHQHSIVDFGLNETTSVRRSYLTSDLSLLGNTVDNTLARLEKRTNKFYYLPDNTDLFSNNIKQGFSGYTFVWRSVAAAYRHFKIAKASDIKVVDLFEHEPVKISIKTEFSQKHNVTMFTRYKKNTLVRVRSLCYSKVAESFWHDFASKNNIVGLDIDSLRDSNLTYNLLNHGNAFDLICNDRRFAMTASTAKAFLKAYLQKHNDALVQLTGCVVYGEFLSLAGVASNIVVLKDSGIGEPLDDFKSRVKKGIPLWVETLPKLALGRVANKGRLGEYILVDEGREVENLFTIIRIPCKEQLTLPSGHKEIRFPLTIGGSITDKSFIAKVVLEEELSRSSDFSVELRYDFDNEKSYEFVLLNEEYGELLLQIEEGEPERLNDRFVMDIKENRTQANRVFKEIGEEVREIYKMLMDRPSQQRQMTRKTRENGEPIERPWEFNTRKICDRIFSKWIGLSNALKEKIYVNDAMGLLIQKVLSEAEYSNTADKTDNSYIGLIRATLALLSSKIEYDDWDFSHFIENDERKKLKFAVERRILCNPHFSQVNIMVIRSMCKYMDDVVSAFALPLLVNDSLLKYFCQSMIEELATVATFLTNRFQKLCDIDKNKNVPVFVRIIRDSYEFILGLLKLRDTQYWSSVKKIEEALPHCIELEKKLYDKFFRESKEDFAKIRTYSDLVRSQHWVDSNGNSIDADLRISRIQFDGNQNYHALNMMHPLALTAITYLEGNPDIHIIGCGLKDEAD